MLEPKNFHLKNQHSTELKVNLLECVSRSAAVLILLYTPTQMEKYLAGWKKNSDTSISSQGL